MYCLLVGLRFAFAIPAELRANWVFRLNGGCQAGRPLAGVRQAMTLAVVLPVLVALAPVHAALWGVRVAVMHWLAGVVMSRLLVEALLVGARKIPFTAGYQPGQMMLRTRWPLALLGLVVFSRGFAWLEHASMSRAPVFAALIVAVWAVTRAIRVAQRLGPVRDAELVFQDEEDVSLVTLGLGDAVGKGVSS